MLKILLMAWPCATTTCYASVELYDSMEKCIVARDESIYFSRLRGGGAICFEVEAVRKIKAERL